MAQKTYTEKEVKDILVSVFLFSNANNNQGIKILKGKNMGDMAETVLRAWSDPNVDNAIITAVGKFEKD